jgi:uncharacterized protein (TIGR02444 family)
MSLWDWSVRVYARPGVPQACLLLQNQYQQNVPLLLAAAWAAREGRTLPLADAITLVRAFETQVVSPLRGVRTELKTPLPPVRDELREALRERVKTVELLAERVLLETLEQIASPPDQPISAGVSAVAATVSAWARAGDFSLPPLADIKSLSSLICYEGEA